MIDNGAVSLLAELQGLCAIPKDFHPTGWWQEQWGKRGSQTRTYLKRAVDEGKIERRDFFVQKDDGKICLIPHYRMI